MTSDAQHPGDRVRDRWAADESVFAAWSTLADLLVAETIASTCVDAVVVDLQHGHAGWGDLPALARAIRHGGAAPIVRLQWHRPELVMRALDAGAETVMVPMVESAAQAAAAAQACRYPPAGDRSWGRLHLPADAERPLAATEVNDRVRCLVMIETVAAQEALEDILAIDGVDGVFIGPYDLALACGYGGRTYRDCPELDALIADVVGRCRAAGKIAGLYCDDAVMATEWASRGVRLLTIGSDLSLLWSAYRSAVGQARQGHADPPA